jgi:hypothetical protein
MALTLDPAVLPVPSGVEPWRDRLLKIYLPQLYLMRFSLALALGLVGYLPRSARRSGLTLRAARFYV